MDMIEMDLDGGRRSSSTLDDGYGTILRTPQNIGVWYDITHSKSRKYMVNYTKKGIRAKTIPRGVIMLTSNILLRDPKSRTAVQKSGQNTTWTNLNAPQDK